MQYFRPGSQLRQLITMLSIVGEYPIRSLYLLGNERAYKALVHKLTTPETFRIPQTETELTTRLLTVTGKGNSRSVRFYKGALPILDSVYDYKPASDTMIPEPIRSDTKPTPPRKAARRKSLYSSAQPPSEF